jgi:integrase
MRFLSDEDGDKLLADLTDRSQQLHDICLLSFDTGMRADEIFSLKRNRVDLAKKTIKVFDGKGRDRIVFMTDRVAKMLHRLPRDGEMVFLSREGKQIKEISNSFDRAVKALGLNDGIKDRRDKLVFHSLRHSFASRLVERGVDLYIVAQLMGHASIAMTERYSHLRPDTLKAAVKSLEETTTQLAVEEKVAGLKG